jgi:hypothetical protein
MEHNKKVADKKEDLFDKYSDEINKAYERAVHEALLMHKRAGNPVPVMRGDKIIMLQPDDIE